VQALGIGETKRISVLAPLRNHLYRRLWIATLLSNFGVWIQSVAAAWLMTSIAPTVDFVAWVQAATSLPPLLFTLVGGVLADRLDQRLVFLVAQTIVLAVALSLSLLDHLGLMTPWLLLALTFALDSGSALRYPAYQTTIGELVPREEIPSALVLSSIGWNIARAMGPGIGGFIIALFGVPAAFAVNALCNVYIIAVLHGWRRRRSIVKAPPTGSILAEILAGFAHVHATAPIRAAMLRCFVFTFFSASLWALLPLVAKHLAGGGPSSYGLMLGALGMGALGGAAVIGWMRRRLGLRRRGDPGPGGTDLGPAAAAGAGGRRTRLDGGDVDLQRRGPDRRSRELQGAGDLRLLPLAVRRPGAGQLDLGPCRRADEHPGRALCRGGGPWREPRLLSRHDPGRLPVLRQGARTQGRRAPGRGRGGLMLHLRAA
jgi:MFS family permease